MHGDKNCTKKYFVNYGDTLKLYGGVLSPFLSPILLDSFSQIAMNLVSGAGEKIVHGSKGDTFKQALAVLSITGLTLFPVTLIRQCMESKKEKESVKSVSAKIFIGIVSGGFLGALIKQGTFIWSKGLFSFCGKKELGVAAGVGMILGALTSLADIMRDIIWKEDEGDDILEGKIEKINDEEYKLIIPRI